MIGLSNNDAAGIPTVLGERFELLSSAGTGGMGWVYKARDRRSDHVVAIKLLFPHLIQNPENLARFRNEVLIARRLSHPHIVRTYTFDELDGHYALTMEFVDGVSLADHISAQSQPFEEGEAVRILLELTAALTCAHAHGIVHCDLKPANILLTADGTVKIADFGISQLLHLGLHRAGGNMVVGTPLYMAPEQFDGGRVDFRTDLYSLGVLAFELLTGTPPFTGDSFFALAAQHRESAVPPADRRRSGVSDELWSIVRDLLEKNPNDRPASAASVLGRLQSLEAAATLPPPLQIVVPDSSYVQRIETAPERFSIWRKWSLLSRRGKALAATATVLAGVGIFLFAARTNHATRMRVGAAIFTVEKLFDTRFNAPRSFLGYSEVDGHSHAELFGMLCGQDHRYRRFHEYVFAIIVGGLDLNAFSEDGDTYIHCAITRDSWYRERHVEMILSRGLSINVRNRLTGDTALHQLVRAESLSRAEFIFDHSPDLNIRNYNGDTPLHLAARAGYFQGLITLLRHGADVNVQNGQGETPLHLLIQKGSNVGAREIVPFTPDLTLKDVYGRTPLALARLLADTETGDGGVYSSIVEILEGADATTGGRVRSIRKGQ